MPKFETNGEIELKISPKEFYDECNLAEKITLSHIVMDDFDLVNDNDRDDTHPSPRSHSEGEFYSNLAVLEENWLSMDMNDAKIIEILAKKYR